MTKPSSLAYAYLAAIVTALAGKAITKSAGLLWEMPEHAIIVLTMVLGVVAVARGLVGRGQGLRDGIAVFGVFTLGLVAELVGRATTYPFGSYVFTDQWWPVLSFPRIGWFPILLPFAWVLVVGGSYQLVSKWLDGNRIGVAIVAGLLAAAIDLLLQPVMTGPLRYWEWKSVGPLPGGVPLSNFFAWWGLAAACALLLDALKAQARRINTDAGFILLGYLALIGGLGVIAKF